MFMSFRRGTSSFAELLATKHLIHFSLEKNVKDIQLFGDSKIICDSPNRTSRCSSFYLSHILDETLRLISPFDSFTCKHIFMERNGVADSLSKKVAIGEPGISMIWEMHDGEHYQYYHRLFMDIID